MLPSGDLSDQDSHRVILAPLSTPPASQSASIERIVTITTEVRPSDILEKDFYFCRQLEQQEREQIRNGRPSIAGTVIQPLLLVNQEEEEEEEGQSIPPNTQVQVPSSLDYLEYLENCLISEQEAKALNKRLRPKSWVAIKNFVSQRILGLGKNKSSRNLPSNSSASSSSSINGFYNTSSCTALPRSSARKAPGGQHPLAIVSTFSSDRESIAAESFEGASNYYIDRNTYSISTEAANTNMNNSGDRTSTLSEVSSKSSIPTTGLPRPLDSKQSDLNALKSAIKSGSSHLYMLQIKSETGSITNNIHESNLHTQGSFSSVDPEWSSFAVASGVDQPISPLTVLRPSIPNPLVLTEPMENDSSMHVTRPVTPPLNVSATTPAAPSSPHREFEKWVPPPHASRSSQESQRQRRQQQTLPQPHTRLPIPRLLKQRSFNFPFTSNSSSPSSQGSSINIPATRASVDDSGPTESRSASQSTRAAASCDIPRPIGPPDPIPEYYQHLQNRQSRVSTSFRRRSHGGELDRFPAGWIVNENATSGQATPRISVSDDQPSDACRPTIPRRHASLGVHPNSSSMWGRLLTSIFSSGSESGDHDSSRRSSERDLLLQQQRLLLAPAGQQNGVAHSSQQQLFFYADEVIDRLERVHLDNSFSQDDEFFERRRYSSEESSDSGDAPSFFRGSFTTDANLQGELAQEDRRENVEVMMDSQGPMFLRSDAPSQVIGDGDLVPRTLSVDGKISVSSLALSSPPSYWEAAIKYQGWAKIDPRPEQGQESLPRYTCSVFREGCVNRKTELIGNWRPYRRSWKRTFAHLRGTALRLYAVDAEDVPRLHVRNISLQLAKCEMATDYKSRPNVIRIQACDRTIMFECKDRIDALTWLEHLQAAANIATSLEDRDMPKFHTLPRTLANPAAGGSGSRSNSNPSSSTSNQNQPSNDSSHQQYEQQQPQEQQPHVQQHQQIEQQQLRQRQVERQQQQQQYLQQLQMQQEQERQYLQQQEEQRQQQQQQQLQNQQQQRQRHMSADRPQRPQPRERQMSAERTPRPAQRLRQPSVDQTSQTAPNPFQQLQQVLQNQQEQILMIQCRVQRQQRAQQLLVQSNESSSVLSPTLGQSEVNEPILSSSPPSSSSSSSSRRNSNGRGASGRPQNQSRSQSRSPPQSPPQSPPRSPPQSRRTRVSLMTRVERERTMTEGDRQREAATNREDDMMRSVLRALGQSSDSGSSIHDSDDAGEENEDEDVIGAIGENGRFHTTTSGSFNAPPSARRDSQHFRVQSNQETSGARSRHPDRSTMTARDGQDWERTRFACAQQQQQFQLLQEYHEQQQMQQQQQQQQQQQRQHRQRASWNRRFFSNLWGHNDHSSDHGHGQLVHQPLSVATSS
ncbi:hypothetical protein BGX27_005666 [Mortierella sp. AM989]|nr:hypothetical protein BGX27_005666 [Mortierella sp. AM989]